MCVLWYGYRSLQRFATDIAFQGRSIARLKSMICRCSAGESRAYLSQTGEMGIVFAEYNCTLFHVHAFAFRYRILSHILYCKLVRYTRAVPVSQSIFQFHQHPHFCVAYLCCVFTGTKILTGDHPSVMFDGYWRSMKVTIPENHRPLNRIKCSVALVDGV